jgi:tetratricopeptide (TPR) repeat protein
MDINNALQLAFQYHQQGNLQQAELIYKNILKSSPHNYHVLNCLGNVLQEQHRYDDAIEFYQKAIMLNPNDFRTYYNLADAFFEKGELEKAIFNYKEALKINPDFPWAYNNLGLTLKDIGQLDEAIIHFQKAIELSPNFVLAINNLGNALENKEQFDEAISCYQKALQLNPNLPDVYNNIGAILQEKEQFDEAVIHLEKALNLDPAFYKAYLNLSGISLKKQNIHEAVSFLKKALKVNPNDADGHFYLGCAFLLSGNFKQGWEEYEWRWKSKDFNKRSCFHKPSNFSKPILNGLDIEGHTVLIYAEQGLGDEIQFIRYAPLVSQLGAKVIIECHKELSTLLQSTEGVEEFIVQGKSLPYFDMQCPLLTLPLVFNTSLDNIPLKVPYVSVNSMLIQKWKNKIQHDNSNFKVGLVWYGNPKHKNDRNRSIPFAYFAPFAKFSDIAFYSLQKGNSAKQSMNPHIGMRFIDLTEEMHDFSETAALIENLDLVITVDTAVAHLTGALGKPVWVLLPFAPDWRWLLNREDSPWYPTMRLFRQPAPGDWNSVIAKVRDELVNLQLNKF